MSGIADNWLDQALDIAGSIFQTETLTSAEEPLKLGSRIAGQTGSAASIVVSGVVTVSGLSGMTSTSIGKFITISGAATSANNGTFLITLVNSASSIDISNPSAATDANNGSIVWIERNPYSLEDDLNYVRTDRAAIKGVNYYDPIPTYFRCDDSVTPIAANLANIAGHTTDAKTLVLTRKFENATVTAGNVVIQVVGVSGDFPYADAVNRLGLPIHDGYDLHNEQACYCEIINPTDGTGMDVLAGPHAGERIFGYSQQGATGVDGTRFEVALFSVPNGSPLSAATSYTWEAGLVTTVDIFFGFRECLSSVNENAFRTVLVNGLVSDAGLQKEVNDIRTTIGTTDGTTDLAGLLTNTTNFFPFSNLPDVTPSVVEALNTLNAQIGNRDYTGAILTDGYTITQSLQQLANAIASSGTTVVRTIERVLVDINAGSVHTLPGGLTYVPDGSHNGQSLWIFWRGLLRDPGPISTGNEYDETSGSTITPYAKIRAGDHINYFSAS